MEDRDAPGTGEPMFVLRASALRRAMAAAMLGALGLLLVWLGLTTQPAAGWRVVLLAFGIGALWVMVRLWQATQGELRLTEAGLMDDAGRVLAPMEAIEAVERGAFAFKPSNGFLVRLDKPLGRGWAPGLWWRLGRLLGVGGVTSASQSKAMAEILSLELARRAGKL
jgi:hypothetical protein